MTDPDPPSEPRTRELLERVRMGDPRAERTLFESFRPALTAEASGHRLMPVLRQVLTPEDVVSEVWLRCYQTHALEGFQDRGSGSLLRFLRMVLERVMIDLVRRSTAAKRDGGAQQALADAEAANGIGSALSSLPAREPTPTSHARVGELVELCRSVLSAEEWTVWNAVEVQGLDTETVVQRLDRSPSAIRGLLFRARKKLFLALERKLDGEMQP
jgi:RNA polymerase sigma factor (sigma-70 family)